MPVMVPHKSASDHRVVVKFLCSGCEWVFHLKNPKPGNVDEDERKRAVAWYEKHRCSDFPKARPKFEGE
jgi:hypothetical protein